MSHRSPLVFLVNVAKLEVTVPGVLPIDAEEADDRKHERHYFRRSS